MAAPTYWTAAMVRALPDDGNRYECVDGELFVTPAPRLLHQRAILALVHLLHPHVTRYRIGELLFSPADIELDPKTLVQPDIFVAPFVEGRRPQSWPEVKDLLLAIEVLSPSTARADRQVKRRKYQRQGVLEYWIVDLDARLVERWRPGDERPELVAEWLAWRADPGAAELTIDLHRLFREVLDDD